MSDDVFGEDVDLNAAEDPETSEEVVEETVEETPEPVKEEVEAQEEPKTVPLAALLDERKEWKDRYAELEQKLSKGNERVEKLYEALNKPEQPQVPEFETDPLGNLRHTNDSVSKELHEMKSWREQLEVNQKQQAQIAEFTGKVTAAEQKFAESNPDYWEAAQHVVNMQRETLELLGVPKEHINAALNRHLAGFAATALQSGKDPAQVTYELAKKSGFKKSQGQNMDTLKKGVEASRSVPSGRNTETTLSIEGLAKLSDEDFDKLVDDPKAWSKLGHAA